MPRFEIVGIGRETGKRRVRIYDASDKDAAINAASADGTIVEVDKIRLLPELPATDAQKQFAKSLEIDFPPNIGKVEISKLIDAKLKEEEEDNSAAVLNPLENITPSQMAEEFFHNRNLSAIIITFDKINVKDDMTGTEFTLAFSDNLTEEQAHLILIGLSYQYAKKLEKFL